MTSEPSRTDGPPRPDRPEAPGGSPEGPASGPGPGLAEAGGGDPPGGAWYCVLGDRRLGPMPLEALKGLISSRRIGLDTPVWHESLTDWTTLGETGLAALAGRPDGPSGGQDPRPFGERPLAISAPGGPAAAGGSPSWSGGGGQPFARPEAGALQAVLMRYFSHIFGNLFNTRGRGSRTEYWCLEIALYIAISLLDGLFFSDLDDSSYFVVLFVDVILLIICIILEFSLVIRRLHDIGISGWMYLLFVLPYLINYIPGFEQFYNIGIVFTVIAGLIPSGRPNKWGREAWNPIIY